MKKFSEYSEDITIPINVGDTVLVEEHPPLSSKKRWIFKTIVK